ncbi:uncharacterized protein LOC127748832 [Frankliniella occidentalis]|uniref:Uncharacterized protein LOC127748832 n=1 Tax=Frankliniella occidentalis TaxID=133901 RepID=A0A9C6WVN4_FRAOC|nr:uncharacterized protein LOC127748832 [Frankliniella occidentalis]
MWQHAGVIRTGPQLEPGMEPRLGPHRSPEPFQRTSAPRRRLAGLSSAGPARENILYRSRASSPCLRVHMLRCYLHHYHLAHRSAREVLLLLHEVRQEGTMAIAPYIRQGKAATSCRRNTCMCVSQTAASNRQRKALRIIASVASASP